MGVCMIVKTEINKLIMDKVDVRIYSIYFEIISKKIVIS
jgi:hypothetical protein